MEALLKLIHEDFEILISCNNYNKVYQKAVRCMRVSEESESLCSYYTWDGEAQLFLNGDSVEKGLLVRSVFFENTDYQYWISFKKPVADAFIDSPLNIITDSFNFNAGAQVLFGHINYGNDIGRADLKIAYKLKTNEHRSFAFGYDVLSVKLDYHKDLNVILHDIEKEYRMLSIDFFRRTHHSFSEKSEGDTPDIIWWQVFNELQDDFIRSVKMIVDRPHNRLSQKEVYLYADKLKRITPQLETQLAEHRKDLKHLYRTENPTLSADTFENRFLKYAVRFILQKYSFLAARIKENYKMLPDVRFLKKVDMLNEELKRLAYHPFFRMVGDFRGMTQESLVLKQGFGYSQVYRGWLLLTCSYDLEEGMRSLELKDIATLYEIWCFIELKNLVKELLGVKVAVKDYSRVELSKFFTYELTKGQKSRVVFLKQDREGNEVELAEVLYNPKENLREEAMETNIESTYSYTVPQKPDIVLQLRRRDVDTGFKLTYLFDAKYRIGNVENGVDFPPNDAINQMHRYRDALYYDPMQEGLPIMKEVLGGYILFPGNGEDMKVANANFYKSIEKVNIGAFPLRPNNGTSQYLLKEFLRSLIWSQSTVQILQDVKPQKGTSLSVEKTGNVLAVTVFESGSREYYRKFLNRENEIEYYFGEIRKNNKLSLLNFQKYDYFVPVMEYRINGQNEFRIRDIYRIDFANVVYRKDLPNPENKSISNDDVRIVMRLVKPSYVMGNKSFVTLDSKIFPPRRWGYREFKSLRDLMRFRNTPDSP